MRQGVTAPGLASSCAHADLAAGILRTHTHAHIGRARGPQPRLSTSRSACCTSLAECVLHSLSVIFVAFSRFVEVSPCLRPLRDSRRYPPPSLASWRLRVASPNVAPRGLLQGLACRVAGVRCNMCDGDLRLCPPTSGRPAWWAHADSAQRLAAQTAFCEPVVCPCGCSARGAIGRRVGHCTCAQDVT